MTQNGRHAPEQAEGLFPENGAVVTEGEPGAGVCGQAEVSEPTTRENRGVLPRFWRWVMGNLVQDVPEDSALCEYDCQRGQCTYEEWAHCERRLKKAAGELWPEAEPAEVGSVDQAPGIEPKPYLAAAAEVPESGAANAASVDRDSASRLPG